MKGVSGFFRKFFSMSLLAALAVAVGTGCIEGNGEGTVSGTGASQPVEISMADPGHIHAWREATLTFMVEEEGAHQARYLDPARLLGLISPQSAFANGEHDEGADDHAEGPMSGLDFHVSYRHQDADSARDVSVGGGDVVDNGDGSYSWTRTFAEVGVYVLTAWFEEDGIVYSASFPVEVSQAGGERIYDTPGCADTQSCEYNYQIRWGNSPGHIHADGTEITFRIEIKRSFGPLNYEMPWRNSHDHLTGGGSESSLWIDPQITIEGPEIINPSVSYAGLGAWEASAAFNMDGEYQLHVQFVDPDGFLIDETGEDYEFHVVAPH